MPLAWSLPRFCTRTITYYVFHSNSIYNFPSREAAEGASFCHSTILRRLCVLTGEQIVNHIVERQPEERCSTQFKDVEALYLRSGQVCTFSRDFKAILKRDVVTIRAIVLSGHYSPASLQAHFGRNNAPQMPPLFKEPAARKVSTATSVRTLREDCQELCTHSHQVASSSAYDMTSASDEHEPPSNATWSVA
jgi:hypothetical protein